MIKKAVLVLGFLCLLLQVPQALATYQIWISGKKAGTFFYSSSVGDSESYYHFNNDVWSAEFIKTAPAQISPYFPQPWLQKYLSQQHGIESSWQPFALVLRRSVKEGEGSAVFSTFDLFENMTDVASQETVIEQFQEDGVFSTIFDQLHFSNPLLDSLIIQDPFLLPAKMIARYQGKERVGSQWIKSWHGKYTWDAGRQVMVHATLNPNSLEHYYFLDMKAIYEDSELEAVSIEVKVWRFHYGRPGTNVIEKNDLLMDISFVRQTEEKK